MPRYQREPAGSGEGACGITDDVPPLHIRNLRCEYLGAIPDLSRDSRASIPTPRGGTREASGCRSYRIEGSGILFDRRHDWAEWPSTLAGSTHDRARTLGGSSRVLPVQSAVAAFRKAVPELGLLHGRLRRDSVPGHPAVAHPAF